MIRARLPWRFVPLTVAWALLLGPAFAAPASGATSAASSSSGAWAPLQPQPGGGLQRVAVPWALLQSAPGASIDQMAVLDAQGQVLPSAWASAPPSASSRRELAVPLWAWPEDASKPQQDEGNAVTLELDANGQVRRLQARRPSGRTATPQAGHARWLLDLSALRGGTGRALELRLDWTAPATGQALSVRLEGSDDARDWQAIQRTQLLDLPASDGAPALQLRHIAWPTTQPLPRYLRLQFDAPVPLRTAALTLEDAQRPPLAVQTLAWPAEPARDGEAPGWRLDLPLALHPEALQVLLPALNQLVALRLEQRQQEGQPWQPVHRLVAWRMQRQGMEAQAPAEALTAPAARQWRLVAQGPVPSGLAGQALNVHWHWRAPELVTLLPGDVAAQAGLRLRLGTAAPQAAASSGRLALQTLIPDYRPGAEYALPLATLGTPQREPASTPPPAWTDPATRQRWLLWTVLGVSVVGLAGLAWRLKGELDRPPS